MKKALLVVLFFLGAFIIYAQVFSVSRELQNETKNAGIKLIEQLPKEEYKLHGYGWVGEKSRDRISIFLQGTKQFKPNKHLAEFNESLSRLLDLLNQNKILLSVNRESFDHTNIDFAITWPDPNSKSDFHTNALVQTSWDDEITEVYFLADGTKTRKYIPYKTFKKLVEEKRFDKILHYGE